MPCDTKLAPRQTIQQRAAEVRSAIAVLDALLKKRRVKPVIGPQGAITFAGWDDKDRAGVTDGCAFRRLMVSGSALAKAEIARAELLAGRSVDKKVIATGVHSHDQGLSWHAKG